MQPQYDESKFSFTTHHRIRSHECDRQGVMHNARYIEMLEVARIEYCRDVLRVPIDQWTFAQHHKFYFVRNVLNYFHPARFDDELTILTRASAVGQTSVTLEQIVNRRRDGKRILEAEAVMVSVDEETDNPKQIDADLRESLHAAGATQK